MEVPLRGAGGEPISFRHTIRSHGLTLLPPASFPDEREYRTTLRLGTTLVPVAMTERDGNLVVRARRSLGVKKRALLETAVRRMFRFADDLSPFYALTAKDPVLAWSARGAGRMLASPSVFEDVVKTICTTNCAWSATVRMVSALVALGGGAFPDAARLAATPLSWYRDVARMGYRAPYVRTIALQVVRGGLDLEALLPAGGLSDEAVTQALLALPGIGPYGAAHVMQLLGRHRLLVFDSWTRPRYRALMKKKRASDAFIERAFRRYGEYAGLAFWLVLTRDWTESSAQ